MMENLDPKNLKIRFVSAGFFHFRDGYKLCLKVFMEVL